MRENNVSQCNSSLAGAIPVHRPINPMTTNLLRYQTYNIHYQIAHELHREYDYHNRLATHTHTHTLTCSWSNASPIWFNIFMSTHTIFAVNCAIHKYQSSPARSAIFHHTHIILMLCHKFLSNVLERMFAVKFSKQFIYWILSMGPINWLPSNALIVCGVHWQHGRRRLQLPTLAKCKYFRGLSDIYIFIYV